MPKLAEIEQVVKKGTASIKVVRFSDGRFGYYTNTNGVRKRQRWVNREDAIREARLRAEMLHAGRMDLMAFDPEEVSQFRAFKRERLAPKNIRDAMEEFIALKRADTEIHAGYVDNQERWLAAFIEENKGGIAEIKAARIEKYLASLGKEPRNRNNIRDALAALFRFARKRGYLPDKTTEAEKVGRLKIRRGKNEVTTYSPDELSELLKNAMDEYLPWVAIGAFAGIRTEEIQPKAESRKDPLRWEDFSWREGFIRVRPETAKTGHARIVPLLPALAAWLEPWIAATGPVLDMGGTQPSPARESARLKELGVTYRKNGLRHSFGSYRLAIVKSIYQVAQEMGNSPEMIEKEYHTPMPEGLAQAWFALLPDLPANVTTMAV